MKMKLKNKLLALLILISLVPLISFSEFLSQKSIKELRGKTEYGITELTSTKAKDYDKELLQFKICVESLAHYISEKWGKDGIFNITLARKYVWISPYGDEYEKHEKELKNLGMLLDAFTIISHKNNKINLVYFSTGSGVLFLSKESTVLNLSKKGYFNSTQRPWYMAAKEKNSTTWSKVYVDADTGKLVTTISTPVYKNGKFLGVAAIDVLLDTIKRDILDIKYEGKGYAILVDKQGKILVHPNYTASNIKWNQSFKEREISNISGLNLLYKDIKEGKPGIKKIKLDSSYYAAYYPMKQINGSLIFLLPEKVVTKAITNVENMIWLVALSLSAIIIVIAIVFSMDITEPIEKLKKATGEVAKGNLDYIVSIKSDDEIGELANDFNKMVKRLKKIKKSLEESERKYRDIFEYSPDAIYISNEKGKLLDINKAGEKLFGYSREELLRMNVENLYENKEDRKRFQKDISKKGFVKDYEVKLKRKDGKVLDCLLSTVMFKKGDEIIYQGIIKDITPIKEARKEIDLYNSLLRHDISNRLQIALGILELSRDEEKNKELKELLDKAFDNLLAIRDLLLKLRMISKVYEAKTKKINLHDAILQAIEYYEDIAKEKGIRIHYEKAKGFVLANEMLVNIFSNIIENAIKHSGGKNIYIKTKEQDDYYVVEIEDDGHGIPEDIRDRIFEMGIKGNKSSGSGLGLHLVKKILESFGGKINVTTGKNGTKFQIYLRKYHL